ncbi:MAG: hypothetical protein U0893_17535 [Chloroflexota bacterium]
MEEGPRLAYNPDDGSVLLQTTGSNGPAVNVEGLVGEVIFERLTENGSALALWLEQPEADVLVKMIRHILDRVPIRAESKQLLSDLLPRVEAVLDRHANG